MSDSSHNTETENLFGEFPPVSDLEWETAIREALSGADYRDKLLWKSGEGFTALPFYRKTDGSDAREGNRRTTVSVNEISLDLPKCRLCVQIEGSGPESAARNMERATEHEAGLAEVWSEWIPDPDSGAEKLTDTLRIAGTRLHNLNDLRKLLAGMNPGQTTVLFESGIQTSALAAILNILNSERAAEEQPLIRALFSYDPFTFAARFGFLPQPDMETERQILQLALQPYKSLVADGLFYHQCGATMTEELGIALAIGSEYLAAGQKAGAGMNRLCDSLWMKLSAGSLYFPEIARFRAARILWKQLLTAYGIDDAAGESLHIHAVTSPWNKTAIDPSNNLIRATTEAMSALIGGADSLTILPYDVAITGGSERSRRLSRNIYRILREEAFLDKVSDPAAGSWYIESLTNEIAENAWACFQKIETEGGVLSSLRKGCIQKRVRESALRKSEELQEGSRKITGINYYPDPDAEIPDPPASPVPPAPLQTSGDDVDIDPEDLIRTTGRAFQQGAVTGDLAGYLFNPPEERFPQLIPVRLATPIEERWRESGHPGNPDNPDGGTEG